MAGRKASGSTAQIAFIWPGEALRIKSLSGLAAIVSERVEEGGAATSYADEMLIRRKVNEVWSRTNEPGGRQSVGMRRQLHSSAALLRLTPHPVSSHLPPPLHLTVLPLFLRPFLICLLLPACLCVLF